MKKDNLSYSLPDKAIKEFQRIHEKVFGEKISKQKAITEGISLIELLYLLQK